MRSRASGGICGDSSAAPSAPTMSSLRRRAIWVQRARSIARSSTGGRASARTTAPASPGSTSSRSQASRSRTSARWKNAAAPRAGAAPRAPRARRRPPGPRRLTERTSTQTSSGRDALARDQPLDVGRHRLRLRALVRAAPERDLAAGRVAAGRSSFSMPVRRPARRPRGRRRGPRCAAAVALAPAGRPSTPATRPRSRAGSWSRRRGSGGWPGRRRPATQTLPCSAASSRSSRPWAKFVSWNSSTSTWR